MHIFVSKLTIIGSDNVNIRTLEKQFNENHTFLLKKMHLKMSSANGGNPVLASMRLYDNLRRHQ